MRNPANIFIASLLLAFLFSCNPMTRNKSIEIESVKIENFSDINFKDAPEHCYFYDINRLPHGFSLGDFGDSNSILYMTESANIFPFDDENLKYFLTNKELETAFDTFIDSSYTNPVIRKTEYFPYERLITDKYVLLIINSRYNTKGRGYTFSLRTYKFDGEPISKIDLAKWDDEKNIYFSGFIMPDFSVNIAFDNDSIIKYKILENGVIEKIKTGANTLP